MCAHQVQFGAELSISVFQIFTLLTCFDFFVLKGVTDWKQIRRLSFNGKDNHPQRYYMYIDVADIVRPLVWHLQNPL